MEISSSHYEKLGQFYLGRSYDAESKTVQEDLLLYDSKDLVTHGVVLGMTGSGKTGLCLTILEEAAMDHIPAIVIDPKGDIANLMLTFPAMDAASFRPWVNVDDAAKKNLSPDEFAEQMATTWKSGLADWGQSPDRIATLRERVDITIFTPGSKAGIPVSILSSLKVPPVEIMEDAELLAERVESTASSLLSLVGVQANSVLSPEAVLVSAIFQHAWADGQDVTLETLIRHIQKPNFDKIGIIDVESFLAEKSRQTLALKFNNLLASPGFATWLEGPPLDIAAMLHTPAGKPRISIFSIAHLGDAERMFFVSLLLNQMLGWMRSQNGTTSLRALMYMDEIFGFLPPTANPPSKRPMMTLLKQGRAFGVGCLLATQNPVDLDYKALSNIGTWFLGRLQTERDKMRVLDGLEGAAGSQNAQFDRASMERLLSGLGNRLFLMNNVHEDEPVLFHVRWAMSYLTGPLTRGQIKILMDPKRAEFTSAVQPVGISEAANPMAMPGLGPSASASQSRPVVGAGVNEFFAPVSKISEKILYRPYLLRTGLVHFSSQKMNVDDVHKSRWVNPILGQGIDWENPVTEVDAMRLNDEPVTHAGYGELPGFAMNAANYKQVEKDFAEWLYRNVSLEIFSCPALKQWSNPGESETNFRVRLTQHAREVRDDAVDKLRQSASKKSNALEAKIRTAEAQLAKEKVESKSAAMQAGISVLGGILGAVLGRKSGLGSITRGASSLGKASNAYKQRQDVANAGDKVESVLADLETLKADLEKSVSQITEAYDSSALRLETEKLKPTRTDVKVESVGLLWLPFSSTGDPVW